MKAYIHLLYPFRRLSEQQLKDVETTIKPLVEMAHKMTDLTLTIHEIAVYISTQIHCFPDYIWLPSTSTVLERLSVEIESDLKWIEQRNNHHHASNFLRYVLIALTSKRFSYIIDYGGRFLERYKDEIWDGVLPSRNSQDALTVAVAAVLHLAIVFQYLIGYTDRGGSKTYSSGCFDFRESFISLLLFHGAYVWIKFRQPPTGKRKAVSTQSGDDRSKVCARASKNGSATKYEARYNIPTDRLNEDHPVECPRLSLGTYKSDVEALFVSRVPRTYYEVDQGEAACCVEVQGVQHKFSVPAMSEQEQALVGEEKRQWVISKAKQVGKQKYAEFRKEQLAMATDTESSDPSPLLTCQPSDGFTDEDFEAMCAELGFHSAPQQNITLDISSPYLDFAPVFENDSLPNPQIWSVQNFQQLRDAGDAAVPYADGTGSQLIGVEQSKLVLYQHQQSQAFPIQSYEAVQPQVSDLQILETSQQISDRVEEKEPTEESIIQPYECLLTENKCLREKNERLEKEKERSDREKERLKSIIRQLLH